MTLCLESILTLQFNLLKHMSEVTSIPRKIDFDQVLQFLLYCQFLKIFGVEITSSFFQSIQYIWNILFLVSIYLFSSHYLVSFHPVKRNMNPVIQVFDINILESSHKWFKVILSISLFKITVPCWSTQVNSFLLTSQIRRKFVKNTIKFLGFLHFYFCVWFKAWFSLIKLNKSMHHMSVVAFHMFYFRFRNISSHLSQNL